MPTAINIAAAREDWALIVGIAAYPNLGKDAADHSLGGPVGDALAVRDWLVQDAGVPPGQVICLTSDGVHDSMTGKLKRWAKGEVRPRREDIETPLYQMVRASLIKRHTGPSRLGRRLWIYGAGHGFSPTTSTSDVALLPADTLLAGYQPNVVLTQFATWMANFETFDEVVLWLDCCAEQRIAITLGTPFHVNVTYRNPIARRFVMTAAAYPSAAYEDITTNPPKGIFTDRLLRALRGGVRVAANGFVTSEAIWQSFLNVSGPGGGAMAAVPEPLVLAKDAMDLVHIVTPPTGYRLHLMLAPGTEVTVLDDRLVELVKTVVAQDGTVEVALAAGLYALVGPDGYRRLFQIAPGVGFDVLLA